MRILIVDDEDMLRLFLRDFLLDRGHEPLEAADGESGLETVKRESPDVVFSDIMMPGMDGITMLKAIKTLPDSPPVILMTGYADLKTAIEAVQLGAHDYMLKPLELHDLQNRLEHITRMRELERQLQEEHRKAIYASRMAAVGQLAGGVAHQVNNPLTFIRGNAQMIQIMLEKCSNEIAALAPESRLGKLLSEIPELTAGIRRGTERINTITAGLVNFSDSQLFEPARPTALRAVTEDALSLLGVPDDEDPFMIERRFEEKEAVLTICRRAITQALLCLLLNARQAVAGQNRPRIRVTVEAVPNWGGQVRVEDSGSGVPEKLRERIFEPFFTTREVNEGAGLGLSVAYGIVATDHGGDIEIRKSDLGGAEFRLILPASSPLAENNAEGGRS